MTHPSEPNLSDLSIDELEQLFREDTFRPALLVRELRERASLQYGTDASLARSAAEKAWDLGRASGDQIALGWGHRSLAEALFFSGRYKEAEAHFRQAIDAWKNTAEAPRSGELRTALVHVLTLLGRYDEALDTAHEARVDLLAADNREYLAKLAMNLGTLHFQRDDHRAALEECRTATSLFDEMGRRDPTAIGARINLAIALTQVERPDEALAAFREANRVCEECGYALLLAQGRMNEAFVLQQMGEFGDALRLLARAYEYFDETDHVAFRSSTVLSRGETYHELNLHEEASRMAEEAVTGFVQEGMEHFEATARYQLALSSLATKNPDAAEEQVQRAAELFRRESNIPRVLLCDLLLAEVHLRRRDPARAGAEAETLLRKLRLRRLLRWEAAALSLLGRASLQTGPKAGVARRLRAVLRRVDAKVYPGTALRLLDTLAEVQLALGQSRAAARSYDTATRVLESIRFRVPGEEAKLSFLQDKGHVFDRRIELEAARKRPSLRALFDLMERGRAQRAWDSFYTLAGGAGGDEALKSVRERLSWAHSRAARLELGTAAERETAQALREEIVELETRFQRGIRTVNERSWRTERIGDSDTFDIDRVLDMLPDSCGLVSYQLSESSAHAVVLEGRKRKARLVRLDDSARIEVHRLAEELDFQWRAAALEHASHLHLKGRAGRERRPASGPHFSVCHPMVRATHEVLRRLHQLLWEPLGLDERIDLWQIAAHGPAHRIPFPALFDGHRFLVDSAAISMIPSARVWLRGHQAPGALSTHAWVGGLPLPELPHVEGELRAIASLLSTPKSTWNVEVDSSPRRETILDRGRRGGLIHLATHGRLRRSNPAYSSLQMADGPLFVHDLEGADFSGTTVVLTACSSGRGKHVVADEWIGLGNGFLHAGARNIVTSLWEIGDESSAVFSNGFYGALRDGADAVRSHRSGLLAVRNEFAHPWHWAPYTSMGGIVPRGSEPVL